MLHHHHLKTPTFLFLQAVTRGNQVKELPYGRDSEASFFQVWILGAERRATHRSASQLSEDQSLGMSEVHNEHLPGPKLTPPFLIVSASFDSRKYAEFPTLWALNDMCSEELKCSNIFEIARPMLSIELWSISV